MVVGLARSGVAAAAFLARQGARVTAVDRARRERSLPAGEALRAARPACALELGGAPPRDLRAADLVVVSPGVPWELAGAGGGARAPASR